VEFLGFGGNEPPAEGDEGARRKDSSQSQDPNDRVQILGAGELTASERRELVEERRSLGGRQ